VTLVCPGGNGVEPGAEFRVTSTTDGYEVKNIRVTVVCEGRSYPAVVNPDGSFSATVRVYHAGPAALHRAGRDIRQLMSRAHERGARLSGKHGAGSTATAGRRRGPARCRPGATRWRFGQ